MGEEKKEELKIALDSAQNPDGFLAKRGLSKSGKTKIFWKGPNNESYHISVFYYDLGFINQNPISKIHFSRQGGMLSIGNEIVENFENMDNIKKVNQDFTGIWIRRIRDEKSDVKLEMNIIEQIIEVAGSDISDVSIK